MLAKLKKILLAPQASNSKPMSEALPLAAAVLLVDVARADYDASDKEYAVLKKKLRKIFDLAMDDVERLIDEAQSNLDQLVSLHEHFDLINAHYGLDDKIKLMQALWQVAYGDGELHHYEEHLIRRIADLLYVPHREFIRTKHAAQRD